MIKALARIQKALHAPKDNKNNFGNYNYRSCEDILKAVKPLLLEDETVTMSDDIVLIGDRYYVKATATFTKGKDSTSVHAFAREDISKKGMDLAQLTGSCSSYSRKYSLSGLFAIDNEKDADTRDNTNMEASTTHGNNQPPQYEDDDSKEWLDIDKNTKAWDGCKALFTGGMTAQQVVIKMRTKYKVSRKVAEFIETELPKGEL